MVSVRRMVRTMAGWGVWLSSQLQCIKFLNLNPFSIRLGAVSALHGDSSPPTQQAWDVFGPENGGAGSPARSNGDDADMDAHELVTCYPRARNLLSLSKGS